MIILLDADGRELERLPNEIDQAMTAAHGRVGTRVVLDKYPGETFLYDESIVGEQGVRYFKRMAPAPER